VSNNNGIELATRLAIFTQVPDPIERLQFTDPAWPHHINQASLHNSQQVVTEGKNWNNNN